METNDLTIAILTSIRDEIRSTNERIDRLDANLGKEIRSTNERIGSTNERLDETNVRLERLERRQTESEIRLATELTAVAGAVHEVRDLLKSQSHLGKTLTDHEKRISTLERRKTPTRQ
jgi:chromosome segregation ATPase